MSILDLFIILIYFLLVHFGNLGITALSLAGLTAVIIVVRLIQGERVIFTRPAP